MAKMIMMANRELKRVLLDFEWELNKVWYGYLIRDCIYIFLLSLLNLLKLTDI